MKLVKNKATSLKPEQVSALAQLIQAAEKRDKSFFAACDNNLKKLDKGSSKVRKGGNKNVSREFSRIGVALPHAHIRTLAPTLFFRDPNVRAYPLNETQEDSACAWEELLNAYIARSGYTDLTKEAVLSATIYPEMWKKWVYITEEDSEDSETNQSGGGFLETNTDGPGIWEGKATIVGVPIRPQCIITDSKDRRLDRSRFIAVKYEKMLGELVVDPRYELGRSYIKSKINSKPNPSPNDGTIGLDPEDEPQHSYATVDQAVTIYEVWVYQLVEFNLYKQVVVLMDDKIIRKINDWSEYCGDMWDGGYPFNKLELNPIPDSIGKSELETWDDLQKSMEWLVSKIVSQVERRKVIYQFNSQAVKNREQAMNQLHSGNPVEYLESNDPNTPVLVPVSQTPVANDEWNLIPLIQGLIQQVTGEGQNRRGQSGIRTATEAGIIENAARVKEEDKVDQVARFIYRDMRILINMIRSFIDKDLVFRLTGKVGGVKWGKFTKNDACWSPDVEVEVESFRASVFQERVQAYAQAITLGAQLVPLVGNTIRMDVMYRKFLQELRVPNVAEIVNSNVSSEVKQMSEIIMMTLGNPAPVAPTDNHLVEYKTIEAFINSEVFQALDPNVQMAIIQHEEQHKEYLMATSPAKPSNSGNPFDDVQRNGNPASEARQETSEMRQEGGVGEF